QPELPTDRADPLAWSRTERAGRRPLPSEHRARCDMPRADRAVRRMLPNFPDWSRTHRCCRILAPCQMAPPPPPPGRANLSIRSQATKIVIAVPAAKIEQITPPTKLTR